MKGLFKFFIVSFFLIFCFYGTNSFAMEVAVTVDDIPQNGDQDSITRSEIAMKFIEAFQKHNIKGVYGFLIGSKVNQASGFLPSIQQWLFDKYTLIRGNNSLLNDNGRYVTHLWLRAGHLLGNHTYNHLDLDDTSSAIYIKDIAKNDVILKKFMGTKNYKYFRYPFLSEGDTLQKRNAVRDFLFANHYQIAPVTIDYVDYKWNDDYVRCYYKKDPAAINYLKKSYITQAINALNIAQIESNVLFKRDIKHILLIHLNLFTAEMLDQLLTAYEQHNVKFISLDEALNDPVYKINPNIAIRNTNSFLNQVRLSKGLKYDPVVVKLFHDLFDVTLLKIIELCRYK